MGHMKRVWAILRERGWPLTNESLDKYVEEEKKKKVKIDALDYKDIVESEIISKENIKPDNYGY